MDAGKLYVHAESLQNLLVAIATGEASTENDYAELRKELLSNSEVAAKVPNFVHTNRTGKQFWPYIQQKFAKYKDRRQYIWDEFRPLLDYLEKVNSGPADKLVTGVLTKFDAEHVSATWNKALERRSTDPEGAITSARTLLESVCKHILDEADITYDDKEDMPKLYRRVAEQLNLAPSQHTEDVFKQILGGCTAVVEGLGTLRNRLSDAHGKGKGGVRPLPRHAELAVNLSGALAMYLLSTAEAKDQRNGEQ